LRKKRGRSLWAKKLGSSCHPLRPKKKVKNNMWGINCRTKGGRRESNPQNGAGGEKTVGANFKRQFEKLDWSIGKQGLIRKEGGQGRDESYVLIGGIWGGGTGVQAKLPVLELLRI